MSPAVARAASAGIKIVTFDRDANTIDRFGDNKTAAIKQLLVYDRNNIRTGTAAIRAAYQ